MAGNNRHLASLDVRRCGLALAGLALVGIWIATIGWLDREAEIGRSLAVAAPVHGQTLRAGAQAHLDVRAKVRGLGAGCVLTATDHIDTWRSTIGKTASEREMNERLGPLRGYGERIAWFDLQCPEGPPTAQPRARRVTVSTPPAPRAEIARVHVRISSVQHWLSRTLGPEVETRVQKMKGMKITNEDESWIKIEEIDADDVRLYVGDNEALTIASDLETTLYFRKKRGGYWVKGRMTAAGVVIVPFEITGYDRKRGWTVKVGKGRWEELDLDVADVWCEYSDEVSLIDYLVCLAVDKLTLGLLFESKAAKAARKQINEELSCREEECVRERVRVKLEAGINEFSDKAIAMAGPQVATLLHDTSALANLAGLAKEMKLGLSRVKITDRGRGLDASVSVDSAWLGAYTPELYTPRRALSNEGSLVVSFAALNHVLAKFIDRPFCTKVAPELRSLGLLGNRTTTNDECEFAAELLGGGDTLLGWTGLVLDPNFALPLRVRPLGRTNIELYVADARPFGPVERTAMGVFARLERTLARRAGGTWTVSRSEGPGSTIRISLEAMSTGTGPAAERVREQYDSIAQLIDTRPGAVTPAWLDIAKARDTKALGEKIATMVTISVNESRLKLGNWRFANPQVTLLPELNALHVSGDIAIE